MQLATIAPLRILVAEDNALIGMLLADMLTTMGHNVCAVEATETDTVASAIRHRPELLIADGWLREGSGVDAVKTILQSQIMSYIIVTGDPEGIRPRMPGAVILKKPFNEASLEAAIHKVMQIESPEPGPPAHDLPVSP
jgi:DNA-binding response OmpR family regulator